MTRLQLRSLVIDNTRRSDKTDLINAAIDLALEEIGLVHDFRLMSEESDLSVAQSAASVALPSDYYQVLEARLIDGTESFELQIKDKNWVVERWPNIASVPEGTPTVAYEENGTLVLAPRPNRTYTIRVTVSKLPSSLTSDSSSPTIAGISHAIVAWATAYVFKSIQQFEAARFWMQEYARSLILAVRADKRRSAVKYQLEEFPDSERNLSTRPWLDPFIRRTL